MPFIYCTHFSKFFKRNKGFQKMSCFLKECQNFFCEKCQVLYFLFVHLCLTDGYISVFQIEAKRWMPFPLGFRAHSALPVLYSVFLISLPIFSGLCCGAYACRMRAINSPCWANRSYIGCTAARNLAFSSSSSSVTSMPAARRSLSDSASCCAQSLRSTLALSRAHRRMISG